MPIIHNKVTENYSVIKQEDYFSVDVFSLPRFIPYQSIGGSRSGVYFLFNKDKIVYVGMSSRIYERVKKHIKDKYFDCYCFISVFGKCSMVEDFYIRKYKPIYNSGSWCDKKLKIGGIVKKYLLENGYTKAEIINGDIILT